MFSLRTFPVWVCIILLSGMFLAGWSVQQAIKDTGQNKCYDNTGEITCPVPGDPFYGQDAQYAIGCQPNYSDNGDGTVTDNCTALMWQQLCDDIPRNWDAALSYCEDLDLAENTNWRLPSISELQSLVDYGRSEPAIDTSIFEGNYSANYSSSTTRDSNQTEHWSIEFGQGYMYFYNKAGHSSYVRCVR